MTSKQRAYLKGLAMTIEPIFQLGKASLTPENTKAINEALEARELIKINVLQNCADNPKEIAVIIAERTHSQIVQVIGKKIILYKPKTKSKSKEKSNTKQSSKTFTANKLKGSEKKQSKKSFKNKVQNKTEQSKKEFKNKAKNAASKNNNSRGMEAKNVSRKKSSRNYGGNV